MTPLEEWIEYLKTGCIRPDTTAPGLGEARKKLIYYNMSPEERHAYDEHLSAIMIQNDVLDGAKLEGRMEGRMEGHKEGRMEGLEEGLQKGRVEGLEEGRIEIARNLKTMGLDIAAIQKATGLSPEDIQKL